MDVATKVFYSTTDFLHPFNIFVQHLILLSVIQQNHSLRSQEQRTWLPIYKALIVKWIILLVSTKGKEWRRVWRKWILMLGCKGLMNWRGISIMVKFHNINEKQSSYFLLFVVWSLVFLNSACLLFAFSISCLLFSTLSVLSWEKWCALPIKIMANWTPQKKINALQIHVHHEVALVTAFWEGQFKWMSLLVISSCVVFQCCYTVAYSLKQ